MSGAFHERGKIGGRALLCSSLGKLSQKLRRSKVLVFAEVANGLDVEGLLEQVCIALADTLQGAHGSLENIGQGLVLPILVEKGVEVRLYRHVGLRCLGGVRSRAWHAGDLSACRGMRMRR